MNQYRRQFSGKSLVVLVVLALFSNACSHFVNRDKDREKSRILLQRAIDQYTEKNFNGAIESALEALKFDPDSSSIHNQLALIYLETKRYQKAEQAFLKALEIQPEYPEVLNNLGVLYNRQDKFKEAIPYFEKALSFDQYLTPENPFTNLGYAYYKLGNLTRAKAYHQKALDVSPQFCLASKNMGDVYAKEKNYQKAAEHFERAATNCPLFQESQYKLGLVLMKMGKKHVARSQLEKLVDRHKSGPYVERSHELLKYLH